MKYASDRAWSDRFIPQFKAVVGSMLNVHEASFRQDTAEATDMVFSSPQGKIALRVRRACHFDRHSNDFTIRWCRPSGVPTEFDKIMSGAGPDLCLYGFSSDDERGILGPWTLFDVRVFRKMISRPPAPTYRTLRTRTGEDFLVYNFLDCLAHDPAFVVARGCGLAGQRARAAHPGDQPRFGESLVEGRWWDFGDYVTKGFDAQRLAAWVSVGRAS